MVTGALQPCLGPCWHEPLTFLPGPQGRANSQLMLASGWECGPAGCQGRPCAQRTFCATVPQPGGPSPPATSCAPGRTGLEAPPLLLITQLTTVVTRLPTDSGTRSPQYKCKCAGPQSKAGSYSRCAGRGTCADTGPKKIRRFWGGNGPAHSSACQLHQDPREP